MNRNGMLGFALLLLAAAAIVRPVKAEREPVKLALLVGVSNYSAEYPSRKDRSGWPDLTTYLDTRNMRETLHRWGFRDEDILVLQDLKASQGDYPGATRAGLIRAFREHLIARARPGDVVFFMFSGHGQLVPDPQGTTVKPDGLDPSMVPYDYVSASAQDNKDRNFRGFDLQNLLQALTIKMGYRPGIPGAKVDGSITLVIDSCHSGNTSRGTYRGDLVAKGRNWDDRIDGPKPTPGQGAPGAIAIGAKGPREEGQLSPDASGMFQGRFAEGFVLFSACQSHESAYEMETEEGKPRGGALVYCLCKALNEVPPGTEATTYRDLFERVSVEIKSAFPAQTPALEGETEQVLFQGKAHPLPVYPAVQAYADGQVTLNVGRLHGVAVGSHYALYAPGSNPADAANHPVVADIEVKEVDLGSCQAAVPEADRAQFAKGPTAMRALLTRQMVGDQQLRVLLDGTQQLAPDLADPGHSRDQDALKLLNPAAAKGPAGSSGPGYDVRLCRDTATTGAGGATGKGPAGYAIAWANGTVAARFAPEETAEIRPRLVRLWRQRLFYQMESDPAAKGIQVKLNVVPEGVSEARQGRLELREDEKFRVSMENKSDQTVYVNLVDIQSDGTLALLFPDPRVPIDNRIEAGKKLALPRAYRVTKPFGTDVYRLVATAEPLDLRPLLFEPRSRGAGPPKPRGNVGPLGRLFYNSSTTTRGAEPVPCDDWGSDSVAMETREK